MQLTNFTITRADGRKEVYYGTIPVEESINGEEDTPSHDDPPKQKGRKRRKKNRD